MSKSTDIRDVVSVLDALCEGISTPRALTVHLLARANEWDQLVSLTVDPKHYLDAELYALDRQISDFLRKCQGLPTTRDLHQAAVDAFYSSERRCFMSNEKLSPFISPGAFLAPHEEGLRRILIRPVRKMIARILGPLPLSLTGKLGPGATYGDKGAKTTVAHKFSSVPTLTRGVIPLLSYWDDMWNDIHNAEGGKLDIVNGNRFTSVPKDSTKNRGICIEPALNIYFQLAVGKVIRSRLKSNAGIDLDHGQDTHREVVAWASKNVETFGTIDLSNASDTICKNLVKLLLPEDWYSLLYSLRSTHTLVRDQWTRLEKFSSMGNGFTFELETLIFHAIASVVAGVKCLTYGDDLIVPSGKWVDVCNALEFFGFEVNWNKSFQSGPFLESCGADYFNGQAVRPYFLKEVPCEPQEWIAVANGLARSGHRGNIFSTRMSHYRTARRCALAFLPLPIRKCVGPAHLGDIVVHEDDPMVWNSRVIGGIRSVRVYMPVARRRVPWHHFTPSVKLASILYGVGADERGVIPRQAVTGYVLGWVVP